MTKGLIRVKEWFFDKTNDACKAYRCQLIGTYTDGMLDRSIIKVSEVLTESEKAVQIVVDAETSNGTYKAWKCWIPKSAIIEQVYAA